MYKYEIQFTCNDGEEPFYLAISTFIGSNSYHFTKCCKPGHFNTDIAMKCGLTKLAVIMAKEPDKWPKAGS